MSTKGKRSHGRQCPARRGVLARRHHRDDRSDGQAARRRRCRPTTSSQPYRVLPTRASAVEVHDFRQLPGASLAFSDLLDLAATMETLAVDGVVITQGTDTIEETSYLLDLVTAGRHADRGDRCHAQREHGRRRRSRERAGCHPRRGQHRGTGHGMRRGVRRRDPRCTLGPQDPRHEPRGLHLVPRADRLRRRRPRASHGTPRPLSGDQSARVPPRLRTPRSTRSALETTGRSCTLWATTSTAWWWRHSEPATSRWRAWTHSAISPSACPSFSPRAPDRAPCSGETYGFPGSESDSARTRTDLRQHAGPHQGTHPAAAASDDRRRRGPDRPVLQRPLVTASTASGEPSCVATN